MFLRKLLIVNFVFCSLFCAHCFCFVFVSFLVNSDKDPEDCVPFACFRLVNPILCITGGMGVLRLLVSAGDIAVMDTRQPSRTLYPVILHAGPIRYATVWR